MCLLFDCFFAFLLDAQREPKLVYTVEGCVYIFMIKIICIWNHQGNSWPVRAECAVRRNNVSIFEFVHHDISLLKQVWVLPQH